MLLPNCIKIKRKKKPIQVSAKVTSTDLNEDRIETNFEMERVTEQATDRKITLKQQRKIFTITSLHPPIATNKVSPMSTDTRPNMIILGETSPRVWNSAYFDDEIIEETRL